MKILFAIVVIIFLAACADQEPVRWRTYMLKDTYRQTDTNCANGFYNVQISIPDYMRYTDSVSANGEIWRQYYYPVSMGGGHTGYIINFANVQEVK